jgi:hypothetical protein
MIVNKLYERGRERERERERESLLGTEAILHRPSAPLSKTLKGVGVQSFSLRLHQASSLRF